MSERTHVIPSALPLRLEGTNGKAVLILHGYTGYAGEFYETARVINKQGYAVHVPRLPGHGTSKKDFFTTGWRDWLGHARNAYMDLETKYDAVSIVGLSMGGAMTLILAGEFDPEHIVILAPAVAVTHWLIHMTPFIKLFRKEMLKEKAPDAVQEADLAYLTKEYWTYNYPGQLAELRKIMMLARKSLGKITCPALTFLSEIDDSVPITKAGEIIEMGLVNCPSKKITLKNSPHVIVSGPEKEFVFSEITAWFQESGSRNLRQDDR